MNRSVEQALTSLIPRHPGALPPELIELASSLLAQSRTKASNLKAEEEIGRTYACANIACQRLKSSLNLPTIEPRPPCPPRVYAKIFAYFSRILTSSTGRKRGRPPGSARASLAAASAAAKPSPGKGTKGNSLGVKRAPKRGLNVASNAVRALAVPKWLGPAVRHLCRERKATKAIPHVLAGVESVLCLPCPGMEGDGGRDERKKKMEGKTVALVAAVWFFVMTRLVGKETSGAEYVKQRKEVLHILGSVRTDEEVVRKLGEDEKTWDGWEDVVSKDVDAWLMEISQNGWLQMDWFENIDEGSGTDSGGVADREEENDGEGEGDKPDMENGNEGPMRGLGTMMQDKYDYLSEAKRKDYAEWKASMLAKIAELRGAGTLDEEMDTTEG